MVAEVCQSTPHPDHLVLARPLSLPPMATWRGGPPGPAGERHEFHLYACRDVLASLPAAPGAASSAPKP